ncbi:MAG: SRPBCC domain-containing protein [Deltaproteobacteria bacterium]|nr:SRPBCC domain-containing protein [Deltaproteobacteria bacterium]
MSVKKEANGRRSVFVEVEVPGTPEQVWDAIASGPGVTAWFVPCEMEQRVGGKITMDFGPGMKSEAAITRFEPPRMFAAESNNFGPQAPTFATEWHVEARAGGTCLVRVTHSLFSETDDWDNQLTGTESGWPAYFRVLRLYLTHFRGQPCTLAMLSGSAKDQDAAWKTITQTLALTDQQPGAEVRAIEGAPALRGTLEFLSAPGKHDVLLRMSEPGQGACAFSVYSYGGHVGVVAYFYFYGAEAKANAERERPRWQAWMDQHFPMKS